MEEGILIYGSFYLKGKGDGEGGASSGGEVGGGGGG